MKTRMNPKILISLTSFFLFFFFLIQQESTAQMISPGEELMYEVSFLGIKLGSIRIITEPDEVLNNMTVHKTKAYIDSYSGIPFVDLHVIFQSWIDQSVSFSHKFIGNTKEKGVWLYDQILFDYKSKAVRIEKWKKDDKYFSTTIPSTKKWCDGLSLYFFARQYLKSKKYVRIPTIIDRDTASTTINFLGKRESVEIDAIKYPVKTVYFNGSVEWTGVYGMTGRFEGWFSDDAACIPIKAKMKVYVGSVNIQLLSWKRSGWIPPAG